MKLVIVESPYAGDTERNIRYAREAVIDGLCRGEAPFASHLLYTQAGILDDRESRKFRSSSSLRASFMRSAEKRQVGASACSPSSSDHGVVTRVFGRIATISSMCDVRLFGIRAKREEVFLAVPW